MPIWKIQHPPNAFSASQKADIARKATDWYISIGLPDYYVNVQFRPIAPEDYFSGGESTSKTVYAEILHIAKHIDPNDKRITQNTKNNIDRILLPHTVECGLELEYGIFEGPAELWRIDGIDPPESFGPDEKEQAEANLKKLNEIRRR